MSNNALGYLYDSLTLNQKSSLNKLDFSKTIQERRKFENYLFNSYNENRYSQDGHEGYTPEATIREIKISHAYNYNTYSVTNAGAYKEPVFTQPYNAAILDKNNLQYDSGTTIMIRNHDANNMLPAQWQLSNARHRIKDNKTIPQYISDMQERAVLAERDKYAVKILNADNSYSIYLIHSTVEKDSRYLAKFIENIVNRVGAFVKKIVINRKVVIQRNIHSESTVSCNNNNNIINYRI